MSVDFAVVIVFLNVMYAAECFTLEYKQIMIILNILILMLINCCNQTKLIDKAQNQCIRIASN